MADPVLNQPATTDNSHLYLPDRPLERPSEPWLTRDYVENEASLSQSARRFAAAIQAGGFTLPIRKYPGFCLIREAQARPFDEDIPSREREKAMNVERRVVSAYFDAIRRKHDEVIAVLFDNNLVSTETLERGGRTPLVAAVDSGHIRTVQQLMDYNADVNAYGTVGFNTRRSRLKGSWNRERFDIRRTPLQRAAELGNLLLVKLLMETYQADDSIMAPDGELALTLAAENGHQDVVDYLPLRRGGSWRRWRTKNEQAIHRARRAFWDVYRFLTYFIYYLPMALMWDIPKYYIVLPIINAAKWLNVHYKELPARIWCGLRDHVWPAMKRLKKFMIKLPNRLRRVVKWLWRSILTIPRTVKLIARQIWDGIITIPQLINSMFSRLFSWLHTTAVAIVTFFKNATLKDVLNGFFSFVRSILELPKFILKWVQLLERDLCKALEKTFFGYEFLPLVLVYLVLYLPKKVLDIIGNIGELLGNGINEIVTGINPKWQLRL